MSEGTPNQGLHKLGIFVGAGAAIVAALIGIIPWIVDGGTNTPQNNDTPNEPRDRPTETQREFVPESQPITVSVSTVLGPNQYAESIDIYIEGVLEGTLDISHLYNTSDSVNITLSEAGRYDYELYSTTQALAMSGLVYDYTGYGSGTLNFSDGNHYEVMLLNYQTNPWQIALR
jgi:hypothetical protein